MSQEADCFKDIEANNESGTDARKAPEHYTILDDMEVPDPSSLPVNEMSSNMWYLSAFVLGAFSTVASIADRGVMSSVLQGVSVAAEKARETKMQLELHQQQKRLNTKMHLVQVKSELNQNEEQLLNDLRITAKESQRSILIPLKDISLC